MDASVPTCAPEVRARQPRLINVDDMIALCVDCEHLLSVHRAKNPVAFGVALMRDSLDAPVRQSELRLHLTHDRTRRHFHASMLLHALLDLSHVPNALVAIDGGLHNTSNGSLLEDLLHLDLALVNEVPLPALVVFEEVTNDLHLDVEEVGHLFASSLL